MILNSVYPCTKHLTFGPWIYLVPQYKPKNILILGYAQGTIAGLIQKLYGKDVEIYGVDLDFTCKNIYGVKQIKCCAKQYIKKNIYFDCIIVDIFDNETGYVPDFVDSEQFKNELKNKCNYLIIHTWEDLKHYNDVRLRNKLTLNHHKFYYFICQHTKEIVQI